MMAYDVRETLFAVKQRIEELTKALKRSPTSSLVDAWLQEKHDLETYATEIENTGKR